MIEAGQILSSPWVYLAVMGLIMLDVYLPVLPSGTSLIAATVYAYTGPTSPVVLLLCAALASTLGDYVAYRVAQRGSGRIHALVSRFRRVSSVNERLRATLRRHPGRTIVFARFIPAGRCIVTFTAGSDPKTGIAAFQPWSALAALCWATYTVGVGSLNALLFDTGWLSILVSVVAVTTVGTVLARTRPAMALESLAAKGRRGVTPFSAAGRSGKVMAWR